MIMKTKLLFTAALLTTLYSTYAQTDIANARTFALNSTVTVTGIVTNGSELGIIRYIEDGTAGIACYPGSGSVTFTPSRGDSITVTGTLKDYNGLLEIDPITSVTILNTGNTITPALITPIQIGEATEGELVQIDNLVFDAGGSNFSGGTYSFTSNTETGVVYVNGASPLVGTLVPVGAVTLVSISSQYTFTTGGYQLIPRDTNDITSPFAINFASDIIQSNITSTSFDLSWTTDVDGTTNLQYGITPALELPEINQGGANTSHLVSLTGLTPATIYYVVAYVTLGTDSVFSSVKLFSTASTSSGDIKVYFNNSVDNSVSTGTNAVYLSGTFNDTISAYIGRAKNTIDLAVYNNNNAMIVDSINAAYNRGVRIRYVTESQTANTELGNMNGGINLLDRVNGTGTGIMHNKFVIIDRESVNESFVITGSTNFTSGNLFNDYNNLIIIQDQAIARCFTIEFEEMWGDTSLTPNTGNSKFGANKSDNTPHKFIVNGDLMEVYFSPTDGTTSQIEAAINSVDYSMEFALLSFTKNELGTAVINADAKFGVVVKGIMESINDTGEEFTAMTGAGVAVLSHMGVPNDIHHKYAIIDQAQALADPLVLTGSHNWSSSAENNNDENTVFIHNMDIANQYYQEFTERYCELDPGCTQSLSVTATSVNANCYSTCDGTATATEANGVSPISYLWSDPSAQTNATAMSLCAGTYTVTVTDANSSVTTTVTIDEPAIVAGSVSSTAETSGGANDGTATVVASGGTGAYAYLWNPGGQITASVTGMAPGTYTVTITDANGCTYIASTIVNAAGCALTATVSVVDETTAGNDGTATALPAGGSAPYTYSWNDPASQTNATATGLTAGNYEVTIMDAAGCGTIMQVSVGLNTGINDPSISDAFELYPNPINGNTFFIQSLNQISTIEVYTLTGELAYKQDLRAKTGTIMIDLVNASPGIYLVRVSFENNQVETRKIIIQ